MDALTLPADLEHFAAEAVSTGRFRSSSEVVAAALDLLRRNEQRRAELLKCVLDAQAESQAAGFLTIEDVLAETDRVLEEMAGLSR